MLFVPWALRKNPRLVKLKPMKTSLPYIFFLVVCSTFVYIFTLAPGIVWDPVDVGTLLASISNPRFFSYSFSPLYFLLGRGLAFFSGKDIASTANLFALLSAVITPAIFYLTLKEVVQKEIIAFFGALFLALFPFFWQYALYANFYMLWVALVWLFLFCLVSLESDENLSRKMVFACSVSFALALSAFPLSVFLVFPLLLVLFERKKSLNRPKLWGFLIAFVVVSGFVLGVAAWSGVSLGTYFGALVPVDPLVQTAELNLVSLVGDLFSDLYWLLVPFTVLGFLLGEGKGRVVSKFLGIFLITPVLFSYSRGRGAYLLLVTVVVFWTALGFGVLWDLIMQVADTEIGTAIENKFFVLIFRLKKEAQALKFILLALLGGIGFFLCFYGFPQRWRDVSRADDRDAEHYIQSARQRLEWPSLVFAPESNKFLSVLRYMEATGTEKQAVVTYLSAGLDEEEILRLRDHHADLQVPDSLGFAQTSAAANTWLRKTVSWNKESFAVFLTMDKVSSGVGREVGEWEGFPLVTSEPLYEVRVE